MYFKAMLFRQAGLIKKCKQNSAKNIKENLIMPSSDLDFAYKGNISDN